MKKMIFSAVALVAFSFAGMANEIEEKRVEDKSQELVVLGMDCFEQSIYEYDLAEMMGATESQATTIMNTWYAICNGYSMDDINAEAIAIMDGF